MQHASWLVLGLLATGCAEIPEAGDLPSEDDPRALSLAYEAIPDRMADETPAPVVEAEPEMEIEPDVEPELVPYVGQPRIVVSSFDDAALDEWGMADGTALCPFTVEGQGFPAVSADGSRITSYVAETLSSSDGEDELVTVRVTDVDTDAVEQAIVVVDGIQFSDELHCKKLWRAARRRAAKMNLILGETEWLAMQRVDLTADWDMDPDEYRDELMAIPAGERPAQLVVQHGEYVARIPGVKVLGRISRDWSAPGQDEMCSDFSPYVSGFHVEPTTGVAVVTVEQMGGPCFCYAETRYRPWPMGTEAVERLLARNGLDEAEA